jgi:hypothetical protein
MGGSLLINAGRASFFEKKRSKKTFIRFSLGCETVQAKTHKSLFGSFSSEKELLTFMISSRPERRGWPGQARP